MSPDRWQRKQERNQLSRYLKSDDPEKIDKFRAKAAAKLSEVREIAVQDILNGVALGYPVSFGCRIEDKRVASALVDLCSGEIDYVTVFGYYVCWVDHIPHQIAFKAEHDLTEEEFAEDHWQTLFRLEHPEARS